jgi:hypothetical protein
VDGEVAGGWVAGEDERGGVFGEDEEGKKGVILSEAKGLNWRNTSIEVSVEVLHLSLSDRFRKTIL